jgi:hypothetical protein
MTPADLAGWVAPIATTIAAMMTAANLDARLTGWGFVMFTIGSVGWSLVGFGSGQANLITTNALLTIVNGIGVWRWLGRKAGYEEGGKSAKAASRKSADPTLFTGTGIAGMAVTWGNGKPAGKAVDALIECASGQVSYVVVANAETIGLAEQLRAVPRESLTFGSEKLTLRLSKARFEALPVLDKGKWPSKAAIPAHP